MLIDIEGIDGVGKTTQCILLKDWLSTFERNVIIVKEPGTTEFGMQIKEVIHSKSPRDKIAEMYAFLSAKSQLYAQIILPQLALESSIIADRGQGSFLSYHHIKTGLSFDILKNLMNHATFNTNPDLTILIDMPVENATHRNLGKQNLTKFDKMSRVFFEEQRKMFIQLSTILPNWIVIDGTHPTEEVFRQIKEDTLPFMTIK